MRESPAFANNQKGYFDTVEIRTLLSLLSVVDNIYMDIDLAAVLRSPMIGMSEEELGRLKVDGEKDSLYECLCETKDKMEKSKKALELLDLLRDAKTYLPLTQLIWLALGKKWVLSLCRSHAARKKTTRKYPDAR